MLQRVRIEVDGATARIFDAATGEEIKGVQSYRVEHSGGRRPIVHMTSCAVLVGIETDLAGIEVAPKV
jgi:hypothetical protein